MKATINDVAKQAGVSIKTVSRVMNNEPSVRQATREKVMAVVEELNYQPNLAARNLAGTKSFSIAFIYDNPNAYYVIDMQNGILAACKKQGFELLIHPCDAKADNLLAEITKMVKHSRIAGLVLTPPFSEQPAFVQHMKDLDIEVVRIVSGNIAPDDIAPCIMVNDHAAAQSITQHLIDLGHKKIAFIAGEAEHRSTVERLRGYKQALADNTIPVNEALIINGEYSFESGVNGAKELLNGKNKPSAIFSCNDEIAAGALFASRLMGISIPEQLSITGFENSPFSRQTWPTLTTADQPNQQIAEDAAKLLIARARKQNIPSETQQYTPQLVVRNSTGKVN
jgi:LacI family transcriptional regulator